MTQEASTLPMVAIVDPDDADRILARDLLIGSGKAHVVGTAREIGEFGLLVGAEPDIVFLDAATSPGLGLVGSIRAIREMSPGCEVILTVRPDLELDLSEAIMAGARGVVRKKIATGQMLDIMHSVFQAEQLKRRHFEQARQVESERGRSAHLISVYSPKGGVGCTTIATNLALALQATTGARVALLDFDLQFGDVDVLLDIRSPHGVHELVESADDIDVAILEAVMIKHQSGLSVLLPPPTLDMVNHLAAEELLTVLKAVRKYFDYVVVDTWHSMEDITLSVMELSDTLVVVTTPEIPALRDTRRLLDLTDKRHEIRGKVKIVVNRYPSKSAVSLEAIERSLRIKPSGTIPSDGSLIISAANEGVSFISVQSEAATGLKQLAASLAVPRGAGRRGGAAGRNPNAQAASTYSSAEISQGGTHTRRPFSFFRRPKNAEGAAGS